MSLHENVDLDPTLVNIIEFTVGYLAKQSDGVNKRLINIYHVWNPTGIALAAFLPEDFVATFKTTWQDDINAALNSSATMTFIGARALNKSTNMRGDTTFNVAGSALGDYLPNYNAVVINFKTPFRGRSYQGKHHYSPISESFTTGNVLTGAGLTAWEAVENQLIANPSFNQDGNDWNLIVLSQTLSDLGASSPVATFADVEDFSLNETLGTMRRRKQKNPEVI